MLSSLPFLLAALLAGCTIGDSEQVDCRCAPDTSIQLFPHCTDIDSVAVRPDPNPLSPQIPDCPSGQQLSLRGRTRPEAVLANLASIFQANPDLRSPQQYMEQFTDDFVFEPDPEDVELYPEIYDADRDTLWGATEERNFARFILSPEQIHSAHFVRWFKSSDERIPADDELRETFIFPYEAEFVEIISATGADSVEMTFKTIGIKGLAEIELVTPTVENPVWSIAVWKDLRDRASAKFSWGELRALFSQ